MLTLGQYLAPTLKHVPVARFVPPAEFDALAFLASSMGFRHVASGPFVRSSYHADEMVHLHASPSPLA
jgi:lipoic acid synthetase